MLNAKVQINKHSLAKAIENAREVNLFSFQHLLVPQKDSWTYKEGINHILLLAYRFVFTTVNHKPFKNNYLLMYAIRKLCPFINEVELHTQADIHKTKQLAKVMYILSERTVDEDAYLADK